jgi:hypothetical protein
MSGMTAVAARHTEATPPHNRIRIGYARVSTRGQDHQAQLDALAAAHCREIIVETASTRKDRPKLRATLDRLQPGDTLVIYKPDRVARSMKELLVFVEDDLHARGIVIQILTGVCAGTHRADGAGLADRLLFAVAAIAAEMERELIRERTLDGLRAAGCGPRPPLAAAAGVLPRSPPISSTSHAPGRLAANQSPPSPHTSASAAPPSTVRYNPPNDTDAHQDQRYRDFPER